MVGLAFRIGAVLLAASFVQPVAAQVSLGEPVTPDAQGGILTIDQERLYRESRFGQKMLADIDGLMKSLQVENRKLEADLEAEEKALTARRATLPAAEFHALAEAFDTKVKGIRAARDAKSRDLAAQRDAGQKTFLKTAIPILARIMSEKGASAIIDRSAIVLSFDRIDITDLAISRVDSQMLDANTAAPDTKPDTGPDAPVPDAAPAPDAAP